MPRLNPLVFQGSVGIGGFLQGIKKPACGRLSLCTVASDNLRYPLVLRRIGGSICPLAFVEIRVNPAIWCGSRCGCDAMSKLTAAGVKSLAKLAVPGMTNDGRGLYLQISKTGGVSWIFRYKVEGKSRYMGIGAYPAVSLSHAREATDLPRRQLAQGIDPLEARAYEEESRRKASSAEQARTVTFTAAAQRYREMHGGAWSEKWYLGWWRKLELYAFPVVGDLPVGSVDTNAVLKILTPIWSSKTRTADEVRGQIENILDAAKSLGWRGGENPARWRGHLINLLDNKEKKRQGSESITRR
ncbi:tyrosine-type recombinase/integrase [Pseudomonas phoenicis]|uniref:tyrosine-type recombinase/integrase n=1 Tax=unclassified Pseudomonas TaxID=196821 RepID=UPI0039A12DC7